MKVYRIALPVMTVLLILSGFVYSWAASNNVEKADRLGEEFQGQMPGAIEKPKKEPDLNTPQPQEYVAPSATTPSEQNQTWPVCYNPYTQTYERCYLPDSEDFRIRYRSPKFRIWWEKGRSCPAGYYFVPGSGCYRR